MQMCCSTTVISKDVCLCLCLFPCVPSPLSSGLFVLTARRWNVWCAAAPCPFQFQSASMARRYKAKIKKGPFVFSSVRLYQLPSYRSLRKVRKSDSFISTGWCFCIEIRKYKYKVRHWRHSLGGKVLPLYPWLALARVTHSGASRLTTGRWCISHL